jgi:hypothetical protein
MPEDVGGGDVLSGFGIVDTSRGESAGSLYGATDAGMTAHRGILHPDEYIDPGVLREAAEEALGFTHADVSAVYARGGRLTTEQRQLREKIDARLLALSRSGGSMVTLSSALGLSEKTVDRALRRARDVEVAPQVKNPAVMTRRVCFKCGGSGAKPVRRRHSKSPAHLVGTVNLCTPCHARGFNQRPGNPAYWEFMDRSLPVGLS